MKSINYILLFIALVLPSGLAGQDTIAYLYLDPGTKTSINGVSKLDREKHFNLHEGGMDYEFTYLREKLDVHVGRSNGEISWTLKQVKEEPGSPGTPDWISFRSYCTSNYYKDRNSSMMRELVSDNQIISSHPRHFMPNPLNPTDDPFVPPANIHLAAELLVFYMQWRYPEDNRRFRYVEPYNEANVHLNELGVSWDKVIDYHVVIADSVHKRFQGKVLSGGSGSAWPAFQKNDFSIYSNSFGRFIDRAAYKMDFLSVHLYDTHFDQGGYTTAYRIGANTRAILNLIENHSSILLDEVKPFVISEYGGGFKKGYSSFDEGMPYHPYMNWFTMKGINGKLMDFLNRPDRMLKTIPFIGGKATWFYNNPDNPENHPYPWVLVLPANESHTAWKFSHNIKLFEFWREVAGNRIETMSDHPDVQVQAFRDGKQVYWIANNLIDSTILLNLSIKNDHLLTAPSIRRLYMNKDSVPVLEESVFDLSDSILLKPSEIVCLLAETPDSSFSGEKNWKRVYGKQKLVPISTENPAEIEFQSITADPALADTAFLEFSYGRLIEKGKFPTNILFNGDTIPVPHNWAGPVYDSDIDFFTSLRVGIDPDSIKYSGSNILSLNFPDEGGRIGSANLDIRYETPLTDVTFFTYYRDSDKFGTLANAQIRIHDMVSRSGSEGSKTVRIAEGKYEYSIQKTGYESVVDSLVIAGSPLDVYDTLELIRSQVELQIVDEENLQPIKNASLIWNGTDITVDTNGRAEISGVLYGGHHISVSAEDYQSIDNKILEIFNDTLIELRLARRVYEFEFVILDKRYGEPLSNVSVSSGGTTRITDGSGMARFLLISGIYPFRMEKEKYLTIDDTWSVNSDTTIELMMEQYIAKIKFSVSSGNKSIGNATILLNDSTKATNDYGIAIFPEMRTDTNYVYTISTTEYEPYSDSFYLATDTTIIVKLFAMGIEHISGRKEMKIYPNPAENIVWIEGDAEGIRYLNLIDSRGIQIRKIKFTGESTSIDVSGLRNGLYLLHDPESNRSIKIIKQ